MTPAEALDVLGQIVFEHGTGEAAVAVLRTLVEQYEQGGGPDCAICLALLPTVGAGVVDQAMTVSGGTAVCVNHLSLVNDPNVANALLLHARRRGL